LCKLSKPKKGTNNSTYTLLFTFKLPYKHKGYNVFTVSLAENVIEHYSYFYLSVLHVTNVGTELLLIKCSHYVYKAWRYP